MRTGAFDPSIVNDPLSCAVSGGQNNTMRLLLAKGAELEAVSGDPPRMAFEQAMDYIKPFDDLDGLPLCMAYGPGFHKSSNQLGSMPSTGALGSTNAATTDCLVDIIANSGMFDISMFWGNSLCLAALCSNFYAMRYLWERGGRIGLRDSLRTRLFIEAFIKSIEHLDKWTRMARMCNLLVPRLYDTSQQYDWIRSSLLYGAACRGHKDVVIWLLRLGTKYIFRHNLDFLFDQPSTTFLINAASKIGNVQVVRHLLINARDINTRSRELQNALRTAVKNGDSEIVYLLLEAGVSANYRGRKFSSALHTARCRLARVYELIVLFMSCGDKELLFLAAREASYQTFFGTLLAYGAQAIPPARSSDH